MVKEPVLPILPAVVDLKGMSSDPTHIPLYTDEKALIEREVESQQGEWKRPDGSDLVNYFELATTVEWISSNDYKRVCIHLYMSRCAISPLALHKSCANFCFSS